MLYRSALQRQIDLLKEELTEFERGRIRVSRRIDGHAKWEDATHDMLLRTRSRIETLRDAVQSMAMER